MEYARRAQLGAVQERLGYTFQDLAILDEALTHTSYVKGEGKATAHNERLEFLGDAVLELCVSEYLFRNDPAMNEGIMTRIRVLAVYEPALFEAAKALKIGEELLLSHGEARTGGRDKPSILSDALEAVIGAIYLDGGLEAARTFIMGFAAGSIAAAQSAVSTKDYKTQLQEYMQKQRMGSPAYVSVSENGPDHKKVFVIACMCEGKVLGTGEGGSKQEAGQHAAKEALSAFGRLL